MPKVLITPRSFGKYSQSPYEKLSSAGIELIKNPGGGILSKEQMIQQIKDMDGVIIGVDPLDLDVLRAAPSLKVVSKYGVGTDNIDLEYCRANGIELCVTKNANSDAVADYAFALLLAVARKVVEIDKAARSGDWAKRLTVDVSGQKIGIVGLGAIGRGMVARAKGFGMEVYAYDSRRDEQYINYNNIRFLPLKIIMQECDFVSLHLPLTTQTKHLISADMLGIAKPNLIIINTARGGLINEAALHDALKRGVILGAGIDAFENEPPRSSPLLRLDNVVLGSHSAASTIGAVDKMSIMAADNLIAAFQKRGII